MLNLVELRHLLVAFQVDRQVPVEQATVVAAAAVVVVGQSIVEPVSLLGVVALFADSATHLVKVVTIVAKQFVGPEVADSNFDCICMF